MGNVDVLRGMYEAFGRGDIETVLASFDRDDEADDHYGQRDPGADQAVLHVTLMPFAPDQVRLENQEQHPRRADCCVQVDQRRHTDATVERRRADHRIKKIGGREPDEHEQCHGNDHAGEEATLDIDA